MYAWLITDDHQVIMIAVNVTKRGISSDLGESLVDCLKGIPPHRRSAPPIGDGMLGTLEIQSNPGTFVWDRESFPYMLVELERGAETPLLFGRLESVEWAKKVLEETY